MGGAPADVAGSGGAGGALGDRAPAHRPTGRWVAFGTEARCRALAAPLAEVDALLARVAAERTAGALRAAMTANEQRTMGGGRVAERTPATGVALSVPGVRPPSAGQAVSTTR